MSQVDDFSIRNYQNKDDGKVVSLLDHVFQGWPDKDLPCSNVEHWRWKYLDTPIDAQLMGIVESNGRVVGTNLGFYLNVKVGDNIKLCAQETDGSLHEDFRGRGIYYKLAEFKDALLAENGACFSYWVTTNPSLIKRVDTLENRELFPKSIVELVKIEDIDLHLKETGTKDEWLKKLGFMALSAFSRVRGKRSMKNYEGYKLNNVESFSSEMEVFWYSIKDNFKFIVEKSVSYLNWRYCDVRGGEYIIRNVTLGESVVGFIVLRINKYRGYPTGYIVELLVHRDHFDAAYLLMEFALKFFEENNVNVVRTWVVEDHPYREIIESFGFINSRSPPPTVIMKPVLTDEDYYNFKAADDPEIHFCIGDTEWI